MSNILIIEDEPRIASFLEKGLRSHGHMTTIVDNGDVALAMMRDDRFELVLLDLGLPKRDGLDVLAVARDRGALMPIIVLTARDEVESRISGLDLGANDYLTKPFSFDELLARIRARLRDRNVSNVERDQLRVGDIRLDLDTRRIHTSNGVVELTAREFTLAEVLFRNAGKVLSREQLLDRVWGYDFDPGSNVVEVYIRYLRRKLGDDVVETVRGMGYRLRDRTQSHRHDH